MVKAEDFFNADQRARILEAIRAAELNTSGEIRVHLEDTCQGDVLDCAAALFQKLNMHKTEKRNGVLFFLALQNKKFAILGDAGINAVTPENFWDEIRLTLQSFFKEDKFAEGLVSGITMAGEALNKHFPCQRNDKNELPDDISYGENSI
jgi:uncharacterized membrane protein